jgi:cell division cycle 2-like
MHKNWVMHRDLKTSNLLYKNENGILQICDFGLARTFGEPIKQYTNLVVTLWYRAPELLLGAKKYSKAIDMWSVGCVIAEIILSSPLFVGTNELDQIDKIFKVLGNPTEQRWPNWKELRFG